MAVPAGGDHFNLCANENSQTRSTRFHDVMPESRAAEGSRSSHDVEDLLWDQIQAVAGPKIDVDGLLNLSIDPWKTGIGRHRPRSNEGLHTYSRQRTTPTIGQITEILVDGELHCSVAEVAALLRCPGEGDFNATMTTIHGRSFQHGSIIYSFNSTKAREACNESLRPGFLAPYCCVKTVGFAHPRSALLGHDERWCFLEQFAPLMKNLIPSQDGFTLSQCSVHTEGLPQSMRPPVKLVRSKRSLGFSGLSKHTHQLTGLSLGYSVELISDRQPAAVRFVLYGCHSNAKFESSTVVLRRLRRLARCILKIPDIIRRRRFSAQVPANAWFVSLKQPSTSSRCVSCSHSLHRFLMVKKSRCYLCAHFVCSRCWIRQPVETVNGRNILVLVCPHCLRSVQNCNYAHLAASLMSEPGSDSSASNSSRTSALGNAIEPFTRIAKVLPDADNAPEPGHTIVSYLKKVLRGKGEADSSSDNEFVLDATTPAKAYTALNVLHHLTSVLDEGINRVMAHYFLPRDNNDNVSPELEPDTSTMLQKLQTQFAREVLPLEACKLSNAVTRSYSIDTTSRGSIASIPVGPIPPNEAHRLRAITQEQLLAANGSDELNFVCELATQELSCAATLVTIVGRTLQYVLASNLPLFQNAKLPREHTLCQHLLMSDRPMLVQHPEADVRFCNLSIVVDFGTQFYIGFPIFSSDGLSVVGSLCCLDVRSRGMTQSQYSTLLHLTKAASNIITDRCGHPRTLKPLQTRG